eukprot:1436977-Lingulodinium_polyedra.AAC.1
MLAAGSQTKVRTGAHRCQAGPAPAAPTGRPILLHGSALHDDAEICKRETQHTHARRRMVCANTLEHFALLQK